MQKEQDRVRNVSDALRTVAAEDAALEASRAVEARLRAEVRALARTRRARWVAVGSLAAAAALAIAVAVPSKRAAEEPGDAASPAGAEPAAVEVATAFFPLSYSGMPVSNAQLVRLEVPRAALASFGLTPMDVPDGGSSPGTASDTVQADVLVGEDGVARAVRFVGRTTTERRP